MEKRKGPRGSGQADASAKRLLDGKNFQREPAAMFYNSRLGRIESDVRSIEGDVRSIENDVRALERDVRSIDGRLCNLEGMAKLALWVVPAMVGLITALGTVATVFLAHH